MEKTGRFDYGKVQGFWSAKHPFKKIKDICEYGLTQRSTFPKRKQQKQQLRGHWGKKSQSNRKMEKVNRWGDLPETTTGFCHPKKDTRSGPKSPWMEREKKNASEVKIIKLMSPLEENDHGVLPASKEATVVAWKPRGCPGSCEMAAMVMPLSKPFPRSFVSRILSSSIQSSQNCMWKAGCHDTLICNIFAHTQRSGSNWITHWGVRACRRQEHAGNSGCLGQCNVPSKDVGCACLQGQYCLHSRGLCWNHFPHPTLLLGATPAGMV